MPAHEFQDPVAPRLDGRHHHLDLTGCEDRLHVAVDLFKAVRFDLVQEDRTVLRRTDGDQVSQEVGEAATDIDAVTPEVCSEQGKTAISTLESAPELRYDVIDGTAVDGIPKDRPFAAVGAMPGAPGRDRYVIHLGAPLPARAEEVHPPFIEEERGGEQVGAVAAVDTGRGHGRKLACGRRAVDALRGDAVRAYKRGNGAGIHRADDRAVVDSYKRPGVLFREATPDDEFGILPHLLLEFIDDAQRMALFLAGQTTRVEENEIGIAYRRRHMDILSVSTQVPLDEFCPELPLDAPVRTEEYFRHRLPRKHPIAPAIDKAFAGSRIDLAAFRENQESGVSCRHMRHHLVQPGGGCSL